MMKDKFTDVLADSPIIAAVKDEEGLAQCTQSDSKVIFILFGDICSIADIVEKVKASGKLAMVHLDLVHGLASKEIAVDFIHKYTRADGIITTKPNLVKRARELELYTVLRVFMIDSMACENIEKQARTVRPDVIEVLPGVMPKVIQRVCSRIQTPIIAGGMVSDKEDVMSLLKAGVISISSTNRQIWFM